jgi:hypothetical protein
VRQPAAHYMSTAHNAGRAHRHARARRRRGLPGCHPTSSLQAITQIGTTVSNPARARERSTHNAYPLVCRPGRHKGVVEPCHLRMNEIDQRLVRLRGEPQLCSYLNSVCPCGQGYAEAYATIIAYGTPAPGYWRKSALVPATAISLSQVSGKQTRAVSGASSRQM